MYGNVNNALPFLTSTKQDRDREKLDKDYATAFKRRKELFDMAEQEQKLHQDMERQKVAKSAHAISQAEGMLNIYRQTKSPVDAKRAVTMLQEAGQPEMAQLVTGVLQGDERSTLLFEHMKKGVTMRAVALDAIEKPEERKTNRMVELAAIYGEDTEEYKRALKSANEKIESDSKPADVRVYEYYKNLPEEDQATFMQVLRQQPGTPSAVMTEILESTDAAQAANAKYSNYLDLATQYEATNVTGGARQDFREWVKGVTGSQDGFSLLRTSWNQVRFSEAVASLPPGPASDTDVANALKGFPPTSAKPEMIASFLRGLAKLQKVSAAYASFKADYLSEHESPKGLNQAWQKHAQNTKFFPSDSLGLGI